MKKWLACMLMLTLLVTSLPTWAEEPEVQAQPQGQRVETWMRIYVTEDLPQWLLQLLNAITVEAYEQPGSSGYRLLKDDEVLLQMDFLQEGNVKYTKSSLFDGTLAVASDALLPTLASVVARLGEMGVLDGVTADSICRFLVPESESAAAEPFDANKLDMSALQDALTILQTEPVRTEAPEGADYAYSLSCTFTPEQVNDVLKAIDNCLADNREELQKLEVVGGLLSMARTYLMQLRMRAFLELKEPVTVCMYYDHLFDEEALAQSGLAFYMLEFPDLVAMELHLDEGRVVRVQHVRLEPEDADFAEAWELYETTSESPHLASGACYVLQRNITGQMETYYFTAGVSGEIHFQMKILRETLAPLPSPIDTASALRIDLLDAEALTAWVEGAVNTVRGWLDDLQQWLTPVQTEPATNP